MRSSYSQSLSNTSASSDNDSKMDWTPGKPKNQMKVETRHSLYRNVGKQYPVPVPSVNAARLIRKPKVPPPPPPGFDAPQELPILPGNVLHEWCDPSNESISAVKAIKPKTQLHQIVGKPYPTPIPQANVVKPIQRPNGPPPPPPDNAFFHRLPYEVMASRGQLVMEDMLKEVQNLVDGLKNKNEIAEWCLAQGNVVTDKLAVMKEYNQEVGYVNTFHAPEGRANLVASLQHESRQIQALQEENRQLEYAIEEMERGMEMMMARHREIIINCKRSDKMLDLLAKLQLTPAPSHSEKTMEMVKLLQECINEHAVENSKFLKDIARLKTENAVLRNLLHVSSGENLKIDAVIDMLQESEIPENIFSKYFSNHSPVETADEKNETVNPKMSDAQVKQLQSDEISSNSKISTSKNSNSDVQASETS